MVATGCGDDGGGGGGPTPEGLHILSGSEQVDTIAAELPIPLVVQVFDAPDHPAAGIEVQVGDRTCDLGCRAFSITRPGAPSQLQTTLETDETGQVTVLLRLGTIPGSALVPISVPSLQLADTARYTVEPGNAASFESTPDTAIQPGASVTVHAVAQDRLGNPRPETVSYQSRTPSIIDVSSDGQVTARRVGTGVVGLTAGGVTGELRVAVIPPGTISMTNVSTEIGYIQVVNLDGTGRDSLASTGLNDAGASTWSPDGETIIYRSWDGDGGPLRRIPATGGPSTPLPVSGFPMRTPSPHSIPRMAPGCTSTVSVPVCPRSSVARSGECIPMGPDTSESGPPAPPLLPTRTLPHHPMAPGWPTCLIVVSSQDSPRSGC